MSYALKVVGIRWFQKVIKNQGVFLSRDRNPNKVTRKDVDEVFLATAGEVMYRRGKAKKDRPQIREANLKKAEEIVLNANKKGKK